MADGTQVRAELIANAADAIIKGDVARAALALVEPACRPGERIVAGKAYVFNADLLNNYRGCQSVLNAPANLRELSDDELSGLRVHYLHAAFLSQHDPMNTGEVRAAVTALQPRLNAERLRRGWAI